MHLKDYYSILKLGPSATLPEIKRAYRQLALQYHPDKNHNDPYSSAQFAEIKEAYEVLSNPTKKQYYLQQRWYDQSIGKRKVQPIITPVTVLKQVLELDKYISTLDVHRMDKQGLFSYIAALIPDDTIEKLNEFEEPAINKEIISVLLRSIPLLPVLLADALYNRLRRIKTDPETIARISNAIQRHHAIHQREKYRVWLLLLIVFLLCLLMYFLNQ